MGSFGKLHEQPTVAERYGQPPAIPAVGAVSGELLCPPGPVMIFMEQTSRAAAPARMAGGVRGARRPERRRRAALVT
jgi:hypothetical protein